MSDLDFERIDLDPEMEEVRYEQKPDFAQVVFHNIAEMYPTDAHVVCDYTITSPLVATSRDWVGLYKVGWSSPRDFVFFLWSPLPSNYKAGQDAVNRVVFQAHCLPKDDGEFYQFCYVTTQGCVRGASTPFQFKRPSAEEYVEIEDGDIMMVKTRTAALEDSLLAEQEEKSKLEKHLKCMEKERDDLVEKILTNKKLLSAEKAEKQTLKLHVSESQDRVTQLEREAEGLNKVHLSLREKLDTLNQEKAGIEKRIEEKDEYISSLQEKIKLLINEKDSLTGRAKSLEQEKELFKNHFTTSESTMQKYMVTIDHQKKAMAEASQVTEGLRSEVDTLKQKLQEEVHGKAALVSRIEINMATLEEAEERLRVADDRLKASDEMVNMMKKETLAQIQVITKMSTDLEETKSDSYNMKQGISKQEKDHKAEKKGWLDEKAELQANIKAQEKEIEHLWKKVESLTEQAKDAESRTSTDQGSLYALQTAQKHLKERYTKMKEDHEQLVKQNEKLSKKLKHFQQMENDLRHEVSDLKERLAMGAEEYKIKYLEARKLEVEVRKLNKQFKRSASLSSSIISSGSSLECKQTETDLLQKSDAGTGTPEKTTVESATETPRRRTSDMGTVTPARSTSETGTVPMPRSTSEAATSAAAATAEASTCSGITSADACTGTPRRQFSEAATIAAAETAEASTSSWVYMHDAGTSSEVATAEMGTHASQSTSEVGTTTKLTVIDHTLDEDAQGLLEDLLKEVASHKQKVQRYKQLYHDGKEKIAFLQKYYYSELEKKDHQITCLKSLHEDELLSLRTRIADLESMLPPPLEACHPRETRIGSSTHASLNFSPPAPSPPNTSLSPPPVIPSMFPPQRPVFQMPPPFQTQPLPMTPPLFPLSHANQLTFVPPPHHPAPAPVCSLYPFAEGGQMHLPPHLPHGPPPHGHLYPSAPNPRPFPFKPFILSNPTVAFSNACPLPTMRYPPQQLPHEQQRIHTQQQHHTILNIPETPGPIHPPPPPPPPPVFRPFPPHQPIIDRAVDEDENNNCSQGVYANNLLDDSGTDMSSSTSSSPQDSSRLGDSGASAAAAAAAASSSTSADLEVLASEPAELPAPIQPEVLPTAKMAAIKHARGQLQGLNIFLGDGLVSSDDDDEPLHVPDQADLDEERFHDADGEPQKLCPACNMTFAADFPQHMFEAHVDGHYGPICPMCNRQFEQGYGDEDFMAHVDTHFND